MKVHLAGVNPYPATCFISFLKGGVESMPEDSLKEILLKNVINSNNKDLCSRVSSSHFNKVIKNHEASPQSRKEIVDIMKVFLAGHNNKEKILRENIITHKKNSLKSINILESYYYLRKNKDFMPLVKHFGSFMLDSGAFTFMSGSHKEEVNWNKYVEEYAAFIKKYDIKLFFELDIDCVVGLAKVEQLRRKLENLTNKKPVPVWHFNRGKDYFIKMCEQYPYVALGGIVTKEIDRKKYETAFPWFIKTAHKYGCKIHGLGYTTISNLKKYHFDSVDSTAWLYGNRGGYIYKFNPYTGLLEQLKKEGCRLKSREGAVNNFKEWVKFGIYAERNF